MAIEVKGKLLTPQEAAKLLNVSSPTILNWIDKGAIPFIQLPAPGGQRRKFRIPLDGLLESLGGSYDITDDLIETPDQEGNED